MVLRFGGGNPRKVGLPSLVKECSLSLLKRGLGEKVLISYHTRSYLCGIKNEGGISGVE
jgi:hypothetical protein